MNIPITAQWTAVVGFIMPLIVSFVLQSHWSRSKKAIVAFLSCIVAAGIQLVLLGEFTPGNWLVNAMAVASIAVGIFNMFWQPTGIARGVEQATDVTSPPAPPMSTRPSVPAGGRLIPGMPISDDDQIPHVSYEIGEKDQ